jgi:predicted DsbA family dithiol-disulfide isomerase
VAHKLAIASERITADVVEVGEFPDVAQRYRVSGVPKIVINETVEFVGAQPETRFVQEVLRAAAGKPAGTNE